MIIISPYFQLNYKQPLRIYTSTDSALQLGAFASVCDHYLQAFPIPSKQSLIHDLCASIELQKQNTADSKVRMLTSLLILEFICFGSVSFCCEKKILNKCCIMITPCTTLSARRVTRVRVMNAIGLCGET